MNVRKLLRLAVLEIQLDYLIMALTFWEGMVWIARWLLGEVE